MPRPLPRVSLFWRTFLLIAGLLGFCLLVSLQLVRALDRAPPEQQLAWEIASVINLTRSALISTQGERRVQLLDELAREEDVRVAPLEPTDQVAPLPSPSANALEQHLRSIVGSGSRVVGRLNGDAGLWTSFEIEGDHCWLGLGLQRLDRRLGRPWWLLAGLAVVLSVLGGLTLSRLINRPLANLASALGRVGSGTPAPDLPEDGPSEIAELNRRFNGMARDLAALESDRAVALAGISHDIRTPLTRLRMEIELSGLTEDEKTSMSDDIDRIDRIVAKFVEYGRSGVTDRGGAAPEEVDVALLVASVCDGYRTHVEDGALSIATTMDTELRWIGEPLDLARMLSNLLENALRYGHHADSPARVELRVHGRRDSDGIHLLVRDHGPGVPADQFERLLRPFARLDAARSDRGGSGLGLAIVARLAQRYAGHCRLSNAPGGGLEVALDLPSSRINHKPSGAR